MASNTATADRTPTGVTALSRRALDAVRTWLPQGRMLRQAAWERRHRMIVRFALLQALGLAIFGALRGEAPVGCLLAFLVPGTPALLAAVAQASRMMRTLSAVLSLMFASATLVDLAGGATEAHFHFFVMLGIVSLYQDWSAFGLCVLVTVAHHAVMGLLDPSAVFGDAEQRGHPVVWATIHGSFILAASIAHMIAWRLNEEHELRDSLTQLPNRASFVDNLQRVLDAGSSPVAVLFVDVDDFKSINDAGGHQVGDAALVHAAFTMVGAVRHRDVVARVGGDEFAVLVDGSVAEATEVGERIATALRTPMTCNGRELFVHVSIGAADTELAGTRNASDLLRDADLAMYLAKSAGKNQVVTYTAGVDKVVKDRAELSGELRRALTLHQLEVHYQPVFLGMDGRLCGVEALVRWRHPEYGLVPPSDFIPLAEESGEIRAIGDWVLNEAAGQVVQWQRTLPGCEQLELAVNLSAIQLRDPYLVDTVRAALNASELRADLLMLEVTETAVLADLELTNSQLNALRAGGTRVAIDDFGTGYSSLSYLARLPADQIKIDRSFVAALDGGTAPVALVRAIVDMAHALSLEVQAEGVEQTWQQDLLTGMGCLRAQGFLYAPPLPPRELSEFVRGLDPGAVDTKLHADIRSQAS